MLALLFILGIPVLAIPVLAIPGCSCEGVPSMDGGVRTDGGFDARDVGSLDAVVASDAPDDSSAFDAVPPDTNLPDTNLESDANIAGDVGTDVGTDAGIDAGTDTGIDAGTDAGIDAGVDAGRDAGTDAGPLDPCSPLPSGLMTFTRSDSASVGTPDTYFLTVTPGAPFCASITGSGGSWTVNVSNGTSSGLYCSGSDTCSIFVPAGQTTLLVTAVTDDIGFYTLNVRYR